MSTRMGAEQRRQEIAAAAARLTARNGLQGVTFREVAAEAGVSVALVQHHFASKQSLVIGLLDQTSAAVAARFAAELAALGDDADHLAQLRVIARSFIPTDAASRAAMVTYHAVGAAGLTDPTLRGSEPHRNATLLTAMVTDLISEARAAGEVDPSIDPEIEARLLVSCLTGLSLDVLLEHLTADDAIAAIDHAISRLAVRPEARNRHTTKDRSRRAPGTKRGGR